MALAKENTWKELKNKLQQKTSRKRNLSKKNTNLGDLSSQASCLNNPLVSRHQWRRVFKGGGGGYPKLLADLPPSNDQNGMKVI